VGHLLALSGNWNWDTYSWFFTSPLKPGLSAWNVVPGLVVLACLLGHVIFTDLHGKVIQNRVTVPLMVGALALGPLLYSPADVKKLFIVAAISTALLFALLMTGGFGAGDAKLLIGLALIFGQAVVGIFFLGEVIAFLYAIPALLVARRAKKRGQFEGKLRKIKLQFGPALALATVVPVAVSGAHAWALAYLGGMLLAALYFQLRGQRPVAEIEEAVEHVVEPLEGEGSGEELGGKGEAGPDEPQAAEDAPPAEAPAGEPSAPAQG